MIHKGFLRPNLNYIFAALALVALAFEIVSLLPNALERWRPWDYSNYVLMGRAIREGANPYGPHRFYPLPTMLWIFVPLSLAPDWFRFVWIIFPFAFVLVLFRQHGWWLYLFPPLWFVVTDAMLDAWLLLPLVWLFQDRRALAPISAAFLLFKPHVTAFAVGYVLLHWLAAHQWRPLLIFTGVFVILWAPSFFVDPIWPMQMLEVVRDRLNYVSILPLATTAISSWWSLGGFALVAFCALLMAMVALFVRALQSPNRAQAFQLLQLLLLPTILASNLIVALPTLRDRNEIIVIVVLGLAAYVLDRTMGGFGGGYALIPLVALYFQTRRSVCVS